MYIYIAGSWSAREQLRTVAAALTQGGHHVTSGWLDQTEENYNWATNGLTIARRDLHDIDRASLVIIDLTSPSSSGGYHVEMGYALGRLFQVWTVGTRYNGFQLLTKQHYDTWEECLNALCPKSSIS